MKLIIDISPLSSLPRTGIGVILENLISSLTNIEKVEIIFFALIARRAEEELRKEFPNLHALPVPARLLEASIKYAQAASVPVNWFVGRADAFISIDWLCLPLKSGKTLPIVADATPLSHPKWHKPENVAWFSRRIRSIEKHADTVLALSQATKDELARHTSLPKEKIRVVYPGVAKQFLKVPSVSVVSDVQQKYSLPESFLLFVSTQEPRKNLHGIIKAMNAVPKSIRDQTKLVLAGTRGWGNQVVYPDFVQELDHIDHTDLPAIYIASNGLVYPSFKEGFGLPIVEAFSLGVPVLTSNTSSMSEIAGDAAVLVDPHSADNIQVGIEKLLTMNRKTKLDFIRKGKKRAIKYTFDKMAQKVMNLVNQAV